ncbi:MULTISPECIES: xanthine dehydrogenase family protein subunit M [unclassified Pseudonocardia]|uniref:FAD binding domain-containing protein n=1 Tax=unclassified Pseudonocardia TaxID=2619320 RepID=UPI0007612A69|nr:MULTISPECIES: FAD binding domain-containing protein [unclassified Pseudonocardia]
MIPVLHLPGTVDELVDGLADAADPAIVAGGTMLMPRLANRTRRPDVLLALDRLPRSATVTVDERGTATIGPLATYTSMLDHPAAPPLLVRISRGITGGPQIRNQGTLAGAACFANPASDMLAGLVAAGATMHLADVTGTREVPAADFFTGPFRTAAATGAALLAITVPDAAGHRFGYCKIKRSESSWPLATAAVLRRPDDSVVVAVGAAVERPVVLELDPGLPPDRGVLADRIEDACATGDVRWWADELADARYRRRVAPVAVQRALAAAWQDEEDAT